MRNCRQCGAAALVTTVLLSMTAAMVLLYMNRNLIFEQRTSVNQLHATLAQEAAEAGLEWAIGMMNTPQAIGSHCEVLAAPAAGSQSFRQRYVQTYWGRTPTAAEQDAFQTYYEDTSAVVPVRLTFPACKLDGAALQCQCPAVDTATLAVDAAGRPGDTGGVAALGVAVLPAFVVALAPVPAVHPPSDRPQLHEPLVVRVTVTGCTATAGSCAPGTHSGGNGPDAVASVSALVQISPLLRAGPAAALTCGGDCVLAGGQISNTDLGTNGVAVHAGGAILPGAAAITTLPGQPPQQAFRAGDQTLHVLASTDEDCSDAGIFRAYLGAVLNDPGPQWATIHCTSASDCGAQLAAAPHARGFYFPDGLVLQGGQFGSLQDPILMVTPGAAQVGGGAQLFGVLLGNDVVQGAASIQGAVVACRQHKFGGAGALAYDAALIRGLQRGAAAQVVRVPGSWTDACALGSAASPVPPLLNCE